MTVRQAALALCWSFLSISIGCPFALAAGQNKLIAKKFDWHVAQTDHFDLYYYQGGEPFLTPVSQYLETAYEKVTRGLDISIPKRSPFFLFLNHNDFEQNNIVDVGEGTGGVTEAFKNRFLVFNDGTQRWLEHVIVHEFVHVAQFHVLYSGFWKSVRLLKSVLYPLWFMEGMAEYFTGEVDDVQKDMVLRDAITSKKYISLTMLHGFNHVKPHQVTLAYKTGNAALSFIAKEYGKDKIGILLNNIAEKFDMNSTLQEIIGLNVAQLDEKLKESLEEQFADETKDLKEPDFYGSALTRPDQLYPVLNSNPTFFPDGKKFAYLSDRGGFTEIFVYDFSIDRSVALNIQKRFPEQVENIHRNGSALSVSPDGKVIIFAGECKQKDYLYYYDISRERLKRIRVSLDSVHSPQFSPDGKKIAFIGMKDGTTDLFVANKDGRSLRQITHTFNDENYVRFFPDGKTILFSRESSSGTDEKHAGRNLWIYKLESGKEIQLAQIKGNEIQPSISPSGNEIVYVGDEDGISNLYKMPVTGDAGGLPVQLTKVIGGNFHPAYSPDSADILFVSHRAGEQHIYKMSKEEVTPLSKKKEEDKKENKEPKKESKTKVEKSTAPADAEIKSVFWRGGRPYRFKASTDFFFPIFFYSSTDGLFLSAYWQASEMLGNHQVQTAVTYASAFNFLNYQLFYSYARFRPQIFFGFVGDTQENVLLSVRETRREDAQFMGVAYPLSRFDTLQFRILTTQRRIQFTDDNFVTLKISGRENVAALSYLRDVSQGRYLETTSGYRLGVSIEDSNEKYQSSLNYRNIFGTLHQFVPIHKEGAIAFRFFGGASFGPDRQFFRTGGSDLLRGFGRFDPQSAANQFLISNLEIRFPLLFDMNYHLWFFFPDFLFKNIYGAVFTDNGLLWNDRDQLLKQSFGDVKNSVGLGLRFQAFVLQTFPIVLQFDWARRTADGDQTFYVGLGPNF